jgi:hypothetical protein
MPTVTHWRLWMLLAGLLLAGGPLSTGCSSPPRTAPPPGADSSQTYEAAPHSLPLAAPLDTPDVEISGLTWHGDTLVVLPQHPTRPLDDAPPQVFGLSRAALTQALSAPTAAPIEPITFPFEADGLREQMADYQGCEAIAFVQDRVYVVTEGGAEEGAGMQGKLIRGRVSAGPQKIQIRDLQGQALPQQAELPNMSYEALTMRGDTAIALFEANGARVNDTARAYRFGPNLQPLSPVSFPVLEYRLTDATALDDQNRFWVINYFFPGDRDFLHPAPDTLAHRRSPRPTPRIADGVERLVEYRYTSHGIHRTDAPPLWLELGDEPRNWEGLVRFRNGFLVATDRFPSTILAYVPHRRVKEVAGDRTEK